MNREKKMPLVRTTPAEETTAKSTGQASFAVSRIAHPAEIAQQVAAELAADFDESGIRRGLYLLGRVGQPNAAQRLRGGSR